MNESFLYYIWHLQYYDRRELFTTHGESLEIFRPGTLNHDAGPDFSNASVKIAGIVWSGTVEIHTKSSDWLQHGHNHDDAYENVILHVVWQFDKEICRVDKSIVPTLVLKDRVDPALVRDYRKLIHNPFEIPCTGSFAGVSGVVKHAMLVRAMMQRLERKAKEVIDMFRINNCDWEETTYQILARNFGFKVNGEPFYQLAKVLPYKIVRKHADRPFQVEALLFGQAGLLEIPVGDDYYTRLQDEYALLSAKYSLGQTRLAKAQWKFLRLRPANFPPVRIAQFAALLQQRAQLFSSIMEAGSLAALTKLFSVRQSEYWLHHYRFNKPSNERVPEPGILSVANLVINSVVPLLVAAGRYNDDQGRVEHALRILEALPAEGNSITRVWNQLGLKCQCAFDSQAVVELYNNFCLRKNCLACSIGASILRPPDRK